MDRNTGQQHQQRVPGIGTMPAAVQTGQYAQTGSWTDGLHLPAAGAAVSHGYPQPGEQPNPQAQSSGLQYPPHPVQAEIPAPVHHEFPSQAQPGAQVDYNPGAQAAHHLDPGFPSDVTQLRQIMAWIESWYAVHGGIVPPWMQAPVPQQSAPVPQQSAPVPQQSAPVPQQSAPPQSRLEQPHVPREPPALSAAADADLPVYSGSRDARAHAQHGPSSRAARAAPRGASESGSHGPYHALPPGFHSWVQVHDPTRANRPVQLLFSQEPEFVIVQRRS